MANKVVFFRSAWVNTITAPAAPEEAFRKIESRRHYARCGGGSGGARQQGRTRRVADGRKQRWY